MYRRSPRVIAVAAAIVVMSAGPAMAAKWNGTRTGGGAARSGSLITPSLNATSGQSSSAATINWSAPGNGQNGSTYTATATSSGHTTKTCNALASATSCDLASLDAGTTYNVAVVATLGSWTSSAASTTATTTAPQSVAIGTISQNGNSGGGTINGTATGGSPVSITICKGTLTSCSGNDVVTTGTATVNSGVWTFDFANLKNSTQTVIASLGSATANKTWTT